MKKSKLIAYFLVIILGILVVVWCSSLVTNYFVVAKRDEIRIEMLSNLQKSLEKYYANYHYYPQAPYLDENNFQVQVNWEVLKKNQEFKAFYDFNEFRDPCETVKPVGPLGLVDCPERQIEYRYQGIECVFGQNGCKGYVLTVFLGNGGKKELMALSVKNILNE
jgi:Tfp pilus assembly protein PilE